MTTIIDTIRTIIASLVNTPLTLESGFVFPVGSWDRVTATRIFMKNSPLTINPMPNGGIEVVGKTGNWLVRTSRIVNAALYPNGYCYFMTENGHKYQFTTYVRPKKIFDFSKNWTYISELEKEKRNAFLSAELKSVIIAMKASGYGGKVTRVEGRGVHIFNASQTMWLSVVPEEHYDYEDTSTNYKRCFEVAIMNDSGLYENVFRSVSKNFLKKAFVIINENHNIDEIYNGLFNAEEEDWREDMHEREEENDPWSTHGEACQRAYEKGIEEMAEKFWG